MTIVFSDLAKDQWAEWKKTNPQIAKRIKRLLIDISEHPFTGLGKPELLRFDLSGKWSRRINSEHRIVYQVHDGMVFVEILSMKHHY